MPEYIRALIIVYAVVIPAIVVAERFSRPFVPRQEFMMWAGCWLVTMAVVMISRNFIIFAFFVVLLSIYCHRRPHNPVYLYIVLMFAAPALDVPVGLGSFANQLINFSPARLLAIFFLGPAALRLFRDRPKATRTDMLVLVYLLLLTVISLRLGKITDILRELLIFVIDIALPYFVFSRLLTSATDLKKALAAVVIATLPITAISLIEATKAWRLFQTVNEGWGVYASTPYLFRSGLLRAAATCVQPIALGFACMAAIGCLFSLKKLRLSDMPAIFAIGLLFLSLLVSLSRGPWVGTAVLIAITLMFQRGAIVHLARGALAITACISILSMTSFGQKVLSVLPFMGADTDTEDYRVRLIDASVIVIRRNPFFGSMDYLSTPEMQALIQGEGIIDIVNSYIGIALSYGLVTLFVFIAIILVLAANLLRLSLSAKAEEWNASALLGTLLAMALTIGTLSMVYVVPYIFWTFLGLCAGIIRCAATESQTVLTPSAQPEQRMKVLGQW